MVRPSPIECVLRISPLNRVLHQNIEWILDATSTALKQGLVQYTRSPGRS
jgi:hypothetical protein